MTSGSGRPTMRLSALAAGTSASNCAAAFAKSVNTSPGIQGAAENRVGGLPPIGTGRDRAETADFGGTNRRKLHRPVPATAGLTGSSVAAGPPPLESMKRTRNS